LSQVEGQNILDDINPAELIHVRTDNVKTHRTRFFADGTGTREEFQEEGATFVFTHWIEVSR